MLKPGIIFCPYCCRTHTSPFYTHGSHAIGVELHHHNNTYDIVEMQYDPDHGYQSPENPEGFRLDSVSDTRNFGLPAHVSVRVPGLKDPVIMRRTCPNCGRMNDRPELGTLPTFIVGMVGIRSSGKSAYLNSTAYPPNHAAVNAVKGYTHHINIFPISNATAKSGATPPFGRGKTKLLTVTQADNNTPTAHVILLDVSGELMGDVGAPFGSDNNGNEPMGQRQGDPVSLDEMTRILSGTDGYPGVDAVIFADPIPGSRKITPELLEFNTADVMVQCQLLRHDFSQIPKAYMFTHLDHYTHNTFPRYRKNRDDLRTIPLVSSATFRDRSYAPSVLIDRIYTEDTIARCLPGFILAAENQKVTKGFLVQSCSCENSTEFNGLVENYTDSQNVMDPLLWILNKLQLFPLTTV